MCVTAVSPPLSSSALVHTTAGERLAPCGAKKTQGFIENRDLEEWHAPLLRNCAHVDLNDGVSKA